MPFRRLLLIDLVVLAALVGLSALFLTQHWGNTPGGTGLRSVATRATTPPSTAPVIPTTTTTTTTTLPPPGPGFVAGHVTAVGDSVMLDYQSALQTDIPGIAIDAAVSRQWSDGVQILEGLKSSGQLGAEVIVGLGSNGPITTADFDAMMQVLGGASRVLFVNTHVDRPWQDPNNAVLANGATRIRTWWSPTGRPWPRRILAGLALTARISRSMVPGRWPWRCWSRRR